MTEHRIRTSYTKNDGVYWECSCGHSGSCSEEQSDLRSDKHIQYNKGDTRIDVRNT